MNGRVAGGRAAGCATVSPRHGRAWPGHPSFILAGGQDGSRGQALGWRPS